KSAQIREILISESAWEEMTCLFAPSLDIHRFNQGNPTPAGKYYADVYLNNKWKGLCLSVSYAICHINIFGVYT
ncbi:FimD/PapC N-terminal domain-containing protein, partial [Proteus mirabilis]|uniref:FimD/PapC N-terminal domain-containing protein n=2 Tax=Enterobacterales TaxID=91347 RepID=UPI0023B29358